MATEEKQVRVLLNSMTDHYYSLNPRELYEKLGSRPQGLNQSEAEERLAKFGKNELQKIKGTPLIVKLLSNFTHLMAILLWVGGILAIIAEMPQLAVAVWMVNIINGAFSFWQEFRAEKATEALKKMLPSYARVLRDGVEQRILSEELVPGDILMLAEGDSVSADGRLVMEAELRMDQSTLTGESRPVRKSSDPVFDSTLSYTEIPNLIFAGTNVSAGTGKAVVFSTGMSTEFGNIAKLTQSVGEELSPLQKEMQSVTKMVTMIAVGIGILFFALAALLAGINLAESFIFAIGMIVAFVPEGLLPTVTLALAMGTQRMAKRHALVKRLSAVETLGCTTVICTDKTGTLTQNEMTVRGIWNSGQKFEVTGNGYQPVGDFLLNGKLVSPTQNLTHLLLAAGLCNNSRVLPPDEESERWTVLGDPTEAALKVVANKAGIVLEEEEEHAPRIQELPFESRRKRMSTIHSLDGYWRNVGKRVAYVKGSPKEVLELCLTIEKDGVAQELSLEERQEIMQANDDYARSGLRVLAVAQKDLPADLNDLNPETVEREMKFLGLIAMMDPPRPEVSAAVEKCRNAGIRVVMITGDYGLTAESIARRIGIITSDKARIVTGVELETMSELQLQEALNDEVIFARVAPEHKLRVVAALQKMGHVVAVTGDGVNDAPALKKADIGVAMGISGTDVAKEAAAMILTDDNFASIVNAVEEGRAVYANIKKFTTYIFTSNTPEAVPFILFVLSRARIPLALNVMHILAVDLGTDIVPALALGSEKPEPGLMDRPPRNLKEHVIDGKLLKRAYFVLGPVQSLATMAAFYYIYWNNGYWGKFFNLPKEGLLYQSATAMALAAVVTTQIGNLFTQRSETTSFFKLPLFNNKMIWFGILSELVVIAAIVYLPVFHQFIGTYSFDLKYWPFLFAWAPSLLIVDEIRKLIERKRARV
jgi:magnesium-transporting ATPase (P-type)